MPQDIERRALSRTKCNFMNTEIGFGMDLASASAKATVCKCNGKNPAHIYMEDPYHGCKEGRAIPLHLVSRLALVWQIRRDSRSPILHRVNVQQVPMHVKSRHALDGLCCGVASQVKSRSAASASWSAQSPLAKTRRMQAG